MFEEDKAVVIPSKVWCSHHSTTCGMWSCRKELQCAIAGNDVKEVHGDYRAPGITSTTTGTGTALSVVAKQEPAFFRSECHKGLHEIGTIGSCTIWAGKESHVTYKVPDTDRYFSLFVCLIKGDWSKGFRESDEVAGNAEAKAILGEELFEPPPAFPYLHLNWPDYSVPDITKEWWESFVARLSKIEGDVVFYCMGGHGRTGTAVSIVASLGGIIPPAADPVEWLRLMYCQEVVESETQLRYIEKITDRVVKAPLDKKIWEGYSAYKSKGKEPENPKAKKEGPTGWWERLKDGTWVKHYFTHEGKRRFSGDGRPEGAPDLKPGEQEELSDPQAGGGPKFVVDDGDPATTPTLTKNAYKKYAKRLGLYGQPEYPYHGLLTNMEQVEVEGYVFYWSAADKTFQFDDMAVNVYDTGAETPKETG